MDDPTAASTTTWTVIGEAGRVDVPSGDGTPRLDAEAIEAVTGWTPKPEGWCRGAECLVAAPAVDGGLAVTDVAGALGAAVAADVEHRVVVVGARHDAGSTIESGVAPDVELPAVGGGTRRLFDDGHDKTLVVAFASWCGCRYDLPGWAALRDELAADGFGVVAVAVDESVADAEPWASRADLPVLVDTERNFADAYGLTNVPAVVWVDEQRRVVRPPSAEFSDDTFESVHGVSSGPHLEAVRRWVRRGETPTGSEVDAHAVSAALSADQRRARAEFRLAVELRRRGFDDAAAEHLSVADRLAPDDFTIWRAAMPLRGDDPFGAEFMDRYIEWQGRHGGPLADGA